MRWTQSTLNRRLLDREPAVRVSGITVARIFAEAVAGDCMDFGDGVQQLLVSDILQRDYLRVGVDQAGAGPLARDREIRGVVDLPSSPGVVACISCQPSQVLLSCLYLHTDMPV